MWPPGRRIGECRQGDTTAVSWATDSHRPGRSRCWQLSSAPADSCEPRSTARRARCAQQPCITWPRHGPHAPAASSSQTTPRRAPPAAAATRVCHAATVPDERCRPSRAASLPCSTEPHKRRSGDRHLPRPGRLSSPPLRPGQSFGVVGQVRQPAELWNDDASDRAAGGARQPDAAVCPVPPMLSQSSSTSTSAAERRTTSAYVSPWRRKNTVPGVKPCAAGLPRWHA